MNLDPLAEQYNFQSPFVYANNNPVLFRDILGMGIEENDTLDDDDASNYDDNENNNTISTYYVNKKSGEIIHVDDGFDNFVLTNDEDWHYVESAEGTHTYLGFMSFYRKGKTQINPLLLFPVYRPLDNIAYFGQLRHITGPDAVALSLDIDAVAVGGVVGSPIGMLVVLRGPERGSIKLIYDFGIAVGLDISVAGKFTRLYYNGNVKDINTETFTGIRIGGEAAITIYGVDFGGGISYSPSDVGFIKNAVFGLSSSVGVGVPVPFTLSGNISAGYTDFWKK